MKKLFCLLILGFNYCIATAQNPVTCFADSDAVKAYINTNLSDAKTIVTKTGILVYDPVYNAARSVSFKIKWLDYLNSGQINIMAAPLRWLYNPDDGKEYNPLPDGAFVIAMPCSTSVRFSRKEMMK